MRRVVAAILAVGWLGAGVAWSIDGTGLASLGAFIVSCLWTHEATR